MFVLLCCSDKNDREAAASGDKKQKKWKGKKESASSSSQFSTYMDPPPAFIAEREAIWADLRSKCEEFVARQKPTPIRITLPDGKVVDGEAWSTTPYDVAKGISQGLADSTVVAKVNNELWDLDRPFERDSSLKLLKFDDPEGQCAFWHSSAHILGEALERHYGGHLCYGPTVEDGFYYDMYIEDRQVTPAEFPQLEQIVKSIVKEKQKFERLEMTKEDLLRMFSHNKFKQRLIKERVTTPTTTVYKCGSLIDLCRGPHVRHTGKVKALKITKNSSAYWEGKADQESLQRIYGISFPDSKQLKEWQKFQAEAAKRDHRKIGRDQELFFFHELSPGCCFFQPKGAYIYNALVEFIRDAYRKRGYQEVITPNIFNVKLWEQSGHWEHFQENMFSFEVEKERYALKPMNCPSHCLIFDHRPRSHKELPLRIADFGVLHRNEFSGALSGLTRVRRFQQDDAHIFCRQDQIKAEVAGCLDFLQYVYGTFGFTFRLVLSTRPEKYLGETSMWDEAEKQLTESLEEFGQKWDLNPADGAFYGPKIDITIQDALRRNHQCATIQLDFQLPIRFNLGYVTSDSGGDRKRPVIVHRAMLGSVERMMAILTENFAGKWPFWLSPRACIVVPVAPPFNEYAQKVCDAIYGAGYQCEVNIDDGETMNKKIRNAQLAQYNFILVVGEKEATNNTVNVRTRDNKVHGEHSIEKVIKRFAAFTESKALDAEVTF